MADAVLEILITNVNSFIQGELSSLLGVNEEIEKMSSTLTAIQAVLEDAEEQQIKNLAIKDWLRKLKDAAYVLDDILDECSIKSTRSRREGDDSGSANEDHSVSLFSLNPKTMFFRYKVVKRLKVISQRIDEIAQERQKFHFQEPTMERRVEVPEWRQTGSISTQSEVFGRDEDKEKIVELLLRQASDCNDLPIFSIVGIGGLGKTTLAQAVFNDERVRKHFDLKIWICVSEDFSLKRILQSIIESSAGLNSNLSNLDTMQKKVQEFLQSKKYLMVLDDVWNENQEKWDRLKYVLDCGSKGASILVTTRFIRVATIMRTRSAHHLSGLSEKDNWSLFKQCAFLDREDREELVTIGKEIVRKCGGLPLAAKTLGSLMRFKSSEKEWIDVKESKIWNLPQDEYSILPALRLSYSHLSLTLKRCFSFCAIFPTDEEINKETLIHLWMANGFISSRNNLEMEDVGDMVWKELHHRSFFQDTKEDENGNIESFKIHDLLHDLAHFVSGEDQSFVSDKADLTRLSRSAHHIGYLGYDDKFLSKLRLHKIVLLRTFFQLYSISTPSFGSSKVHSLRALRTNACHLTSVSHLAHLRYLDLDCFFISHLPDSICSLQKLQTLKLNNCGFLCQLPNQLACLQDLRHLVIKDYELLSHMPPNIRKLTLLKTLSVFIVGSKPGCRLAELHDLQLGGDLEIKGLENVKSGLDAEQANLLGKKNLDRLCLLWSKNSEVGDVEQVLEGLQPHSNIKHLRIEGYGGSQLPSWLRNTSVISCLVSLVFVNCENCQQLPPLGKLPSLRRLRISGMKHPHYIDDGSYDYDPEIAFKSLKSLSLSGLPNLERMLKDEKVDMFSSLLEFSISDVPKLKFPFLPSVELLTVYTCNEYILKSISNYPGLVGLKLQNNEDMTSFPEGIMQNLYHLKTLEIMSFAQLEVLPAELGCLSSLEELSIIKCPKLECLLEDGMPGLSSLRTLTILKCEKFRSLSKGVMHLTSLRQLTITGFPFGVIPDGLECIPSLECLRLRGLAVASLPDSLGDLTFLQKLEIKDFPLLRSLPSSIQRLRNLQELIIYDCPKLQRRCKRGTGEWHKIAHVPRFSSRHGRTFYQNVRLYWKLRSAIVKIVAKEMFRGR